MSDKIDIAELGASEEGLLMQYQSGLHTAKTILSDSNPMYKLSNNGIRRVLVAYLNMGVYDIPSFQTDAERLLFQAIVKSTDAKYALINKAIESTEQELKDMDAAKIEDLAKQQNQEEINEGELNGTTTKED